MPNSPALSEYESEWLAEREAILIVDAGLSEADAKREAARLLVVIQERERRVI